MAYQEQLPLPDVEPAATRARGGDDWRLDEPTRQAGRRGLVAARRALARASDSEHTPARAA